MFLPNVGGYPTAPSAIIGLWTSWILMLMIYSYVLYKESIFYRFAEYTYLAISLAIMIVVNIDSLNRTQLSPLFTKGAYTLIVPVILGIIMYLLLVPKYRWISRYPIAILVGSALGIGMSSRVLPSLQSQILDTIKIPAAATGAMGWFNFSLIAVGTILILLYFILTYQQKGPLMPASRIARLLIMIGLGAQFGNTVLFRMAMLSGRAQFFLQVLGIIPI